MGQNSILIDVLHCVRSWFQPDILSDSCHKLAELLPLFKEYRTPRSKTNRFKNSFFVPISAQLKGLIFATIIMCQSLYTHFKELI